MIDDWCIRSVCAESLARSSRHRSCLMHDNGRWYRNQVCIQVSPSVPICAPRFFEGWWWSWRSVLWCINKGFSTFYVQNASLLAPESQMYSLLKAAQLWAFTDSLPLPTPWSYFLNREAIHPTNSPLSQASVAEGRSIGRWSEGDQVFGYNMDEGHKRFRLSAISACRFWETWWCATMMLECLNVETT